MKSNGQSSVGNSAVQDALTSNWVFCVGPPKCATTTLYSTLKSHPDLLLSNFKEPQFFTRRFERGMEWYLTKYFTLPRKILVMGEFSPDYLSDPRVPGRIRKSVSGHVKIIVVTRDPIRRTISHYIHAVRQAQENRPLENAVAEEIDEIVSSDGESMPATKYVWDSLYGRHIKRYVDEFGSDNILVLSLENDLIKRPELTLVAVQKFLGVREFIKKMGDAKNISRMPPRIFLPLKWIIYKDTALKNFLRRVLSVRMQQRLQNGVDRLIDSVGRREAAPEIGSNTIEKLKVMYELECAKVEPILASVRNLDDILRARL